MNAQEFKEKFPHFAHLTGNDLWNAMEMSVMKTYVPQPGDEEVVETINLGDGYTLDVTKGAQRAFESMFTKEELEEMRNPTKPQFSNAQLWIPQPDGSVKIIKP
jgi:hypothetical protein